MKLEPRQLLIVYVSLRNNEDGSAKLHPIDKQSLALSLYNKINASIERIPVENGENLKFNECEVVFTPEECVYLKQLLSRAWDLDQIEVKESLISLLS